MIIEGSTHDNAGNLARYLLRAKPGEKEFLFELRDAASENLREALTDWELTGRALTKGSKVFFHSYIRLPQGEAMNEAQWYSVIERLEEKLGLTNCPRAIVGHDSAKGLHVHVAWSRFDAQTEKLAPLHHSRRRFHEVARWAEKEFDLTPIESKPQQEQRPKRRLSDQEIRAIKDRGINREKLEKIVRAAWDASDSGQEMKAMLGALGVEIKPGDRRDWVVEYEGLKMNPVRLLNGVKEAAYRERMKDVDLEAEKAKTREKSPAEIAFGRKARQLSQQQINRTIANDQAEPKAKTGFRLRRHKAPAPRLRPKLRYDDPGI